MPPIELIKLAYKARGHTYAPCSNFHVGARNDRIIQETTLDSLRPNAFGPENIT